MFLLNNTNYKYSNNYDRTWTGEPFQGWSGKETFTKEDLIPIHAIASFCADFRDKKKEEEQKSKEAELSKLGVTKILS